MKCICFLILLLIFQAFVDGSNSKEMEFLKKLTTQDRTTYLILLHYRASERAMKVGNLCSTSPKKPAEDDSDNDAEPEIRRAFKNLKSTKANNDGTNKNDKSNGENGPKPKPNQPFNITEANLDASKLNKPTDPIVKLTAAEKSKIITPSCATLASPPKFDDWALYALRVLRNGQDVLPIENLRRKLSKSLLYIVCHEGQARMDTFTMAVKEGSIVKSREVLKAIGMGQKAIDTLNDRTDSAISLWESEMDEFAKAKGIVIPAEVKEDKKPVCLANGQAKILDNDFNALFYEYVLGRTGFGIYCLPQVLDIVCKKTTLADNHLEMLLTNIYKRDATLMAPTRKILLDLLQTEGIAPALFENIRVPEDISDFCTKVTEVHTRLVPVVKKTAKPSFITFKSLQKTIKDYNAGTCVNNTTIKPATKMNIPMGHISIRPKHQS